MPQTRMRTVAFALKVLGRVEQGLRIIANNFLELLCPLKHPSELPIHPTLSHAYLSSALPDMVLSTHEKLRQERANLWRAKYLNRKLTGDAPWIPAGHVESPEDWELFEPRNSGTQKQPSRKRKRREDEPRAQTGNSDHASMQPEEEGVSKENMKLKKDDLPAQPNGVDIMDTMESTEAIKDDQAADDDATNSKEVAESAKQDAPEPKSAGLSDAVMESTVDIPREREPNGVDPNPTDQKNTYKDMQDRAQTRENNAEIHHDPMVGTGDQAADQPLPAASSNEGDRSPPHPPLPLPPRRITRALAATNNSSNAPTPPLSPASSSTTTSSSSQLQIDPLYLVPQSANPSNSAIAFHGLLPEEALETRRVLTLYVQKQEESVRGYEAILSKLLTAQRLRNEVLQMCKTEEHVGEFSDGEDWIDTERWGLQPGELKKGKDEDDDVMEENTIGGRKGKRRARN